MVLAKLWLVGAAQAAAQLGMLRKPATQDGCITIFQARKVAIDQGGRPEGGERVGFDFHVALLAQDPFLIRSDANLP